MRSSRILVVCLGISLPCFAAISANTAWEVRTAGASTNGGGFVAGATGTDWSQYDNKNAAACSSCGSATDDLSTTDAVAAGTTTITSVTANFGTTIVGNVIYFTGGTGAIAAVRRQVTARASTTSITIDAAIAASTGMTMNIGGALDSPATALLFNTTSNRIFVRSGTYVTTTGYTLNNNLLPTNGSPPNMLIGYSTSRTDCGSGGTKPIVQLSTNSSLTGIGGTAGGWLVACMQVDCNSLTGSNGMKAYLYDVFWKNKIYGGCKVYGILANQAIAASIIDNEITGMTGNTASSYGIYSDATNGAVILRNWVHDNTNSGMLIGASNTVMYNLITNNSGGQSDGIIFTSMAAATVMFNTIYLSGRDGINSGSQNLTAANTIRNNIVANNVRYGISGATSVGNPAQPQYDGNFFYANGTAPRNNMDDTGATNPINAVGAYTNVLDVILSASPFTSAGTDDYSLNSTAGGGAAVRNAGTPGAMPGTLVVGYASGGVFAPQSSSGSGGSSCVVGGN